jgi:hypothetical protein
MKVQTIRCLLHRISRTLWLVGKKKVRDFRVFPAIVGAGDSASPQGEKSALGRGKQHAHGNDGGGTRPDDDRQ